MTPLRRHRPSLIWCHRRAEPSDHLGPVGHRLGLEPASSADSGGFAEASKRGRTTILAPGRSVTHSTTLTVGHAPRTETSE